MGSCIDCGAQLEPGKKFCVQCGKPVAASGDDMPVPAGAEAVRTATIDVLRDIESAARSYELPQPPDVLATYRERLTANSYQVLVVGEAKRGKSSFINALIGRSLLPTDVDIATSQVFRVHHAEREAYRLRFESGAAREIAAADLPRYGSQVLADAGQAPRPDQIVRWIEVDIPTKLLPPSVSLLDTPGLGSLYAGHTQVTQRFVPLADAVIYVLDSSQPMVQPDIEFIEQLLGVTNSIFFIQTRIDQFRRVDWQAIRQRNQEILLEKFGSRLTDTRVWPVSSANMLKAAETGDEDYLAASRHGEMADALQQFLFRAAGWGRAAEALAVAGSYHTTTRGLLANRVATVANQSDQEREARRRDLEQRRTRFNAEWGAQSQRHRDLTLALRQIADIGRASFDQALRPGGAIDKSFRQRIASLAQIEEAKPLGEQLANQVNAAVTEEWRRICGQTQEQALARVAPFVAASNNLRVTTAALAPELALAAAPALRVDQMDRFTRAGKNLWSVVKTLDLPIGAAIGVGLISLPLGLLAMAGAGVWGLMRGWRLSGAEQLKEAKQALLAHLDDVLQQAWHYFFDANIGQGRPSLVDEYFAGLTSDLGQHVLTLTEQESGALQAEITRIEAAAKLDDQRRDAEAARLRGQLSAWDALGGRMQRIATGLEALTAS